MSILTLFIWAQLHAEGPALVNFPKGGCEVISDGEIKFTSGIPGCTEKRRAKNGNLVTYQTTEAEDDGTGKVTPVKKTHTLEIEKKTGRTVTVNTFDGEDASKAKIISTMTIRQSKVGHSELLQAFIKQMRDGKDERLLIFDQELCGNFQKDGNFKDDLKTMKECAPLLSRYQKAAEDMNKRLKPANTSLGVIDYGKRGAFKPVATNSAMDLMSMAWFCAVQTHSPNELQPLKNPDPNVSGSSSDSAE